jgi:hypothetical protein
MILVGTAPSGEDIVHLEKPGLAGRSVTFAEGI